jgi:hypothetical protein
MNAIGLNKVVGASAVALVAAALSATAAFAGQPSRFTFSASGTDFAPSGTVCDFDYELKFSVEVTEHRYYDASGMYARRIRQIEESLAHHNLDTGAALTETTHYVTDLDVASGTVRLTGNSWHLRDSDGRIVVVRSGLELFDRISGELYRSTPMVGQGFENVICPALGGSPA